MPTVISINDDYAVEKSHVAIVAAFTDENDDPVTPDSITWTLTDEDGTVINSRQDVEIAAASSVTIVLSGDDLAIQSGETGDAAYRKLTVSAIVDSDIGNDLPVKDSVTFALKNLTAIT